MKHMRATFEDKEFETVLKAKGKRSWHDFIIDSAELFIVLPSGVNENNETIKKLKRLREAVGKRMEEKR